MEQSESSRTLKIHDISVPLTPDLPVWPGDPSVERKMLMRLDRGEVANVTYLGMSVHAGTHVDAPLHVIEGASPVEALQMDVLIGPATVVRIGEQHRVITPELLDQCDLPSTVTRVLFHTRNSELWNTGEFEEDFTALSPAAASWIVNRGIELVGIDYHSIQLFSDKRPETHLILLHAGVVIVEGLNLAEVPSGEYELLCLPLRLDGAEGAPARAVLLPLKQ